jgi:hypothetical protein
MIAPTIEVIAHIYQGYTLIHTAPELEPYRQYILDHAVGPGSQPKLQCHHVVPRYLGGQDEEENLVYLTAHDHAEAHRILKGLEGTAELRMGGHVMNTRERRQLIQEVGDAGALLFQQYLDMFTARNYSFTDDSTVAAFLGWTPSKAKRNRLALTKAGWVSHDTFINSPSNKKLKVTFLGKDEGSHKRNGKLLEAWEAL